MTDLLDRIQHVGIDVALDAIPVHAFSGAVTLATLGFVTRQNIIDKWTLVGDEVVQLDEIIAVYQGKNKTGQVDYLQTIIAGFLVYEDNTINKTQLMTILEI